MAGKVVGSSMDLLGIEGAEEWEMIAFMRYRSRRDLMEIATNPDFNKNHHYKMAAMEKTIATPIEPVLNPGEPRVLLALLLILICLSVEVITLRKTTYKR